MKLKHRLHQSRGELQLVKRNVHSLEMLLEARTKFIQTGVVDVSIILFSAVDFEFRTTCSKWLQK